MTRLRTFIESGQAEGDLTPWIAQVPGARLPSRVYESLRKHTGLVRMRDLQNELNTSSGQVYDAFGWLEEHGFLSCAVEHEIRYLRLNAVPEISSRDAGPLPFLAVPHKGIDDRFPAAEFSAAERRRLIHLLVEDGHNASATACADVYGFLRMQKDCFWLSDLIEASGISYLRAKRALRVLQAEGAIRRYDNIIAVFPVTPKEIFAMFDDDEYHVWLNSAQTEVKRKAKEPSKSLGQIERLLNLYDALQQDAGRIENTKQIRQNKIVAYQLLQKHTYEELRPFLVAFLRRPEFFRERIARQMDTYGMTLQTFSRNLATISDHCQELKRGYPRDPDWYWKELLRKDNLRGFWDA